MTGHKQINQLFSALLQGSSSIHLLGEALELYPTTQGLAARFPNQVHILPASDNAQIGLAIGMAMTGACPILTLATPESLWNILPQLGQECPPKGTEFPLNMVIRVPVPPETSLQIDSLLGIPQIHVVAPGSLQEALQMLQLATELPSPVVLIEQQEILFAKDQPQPPEKDILSAQIIKEGDDITLLTWGANRQCALDVANEVASEGISVEVVDLRSLHPLDSETVASSVYKTGRPICIDAPVNTIHAVINGAFWRLENQPLHVTASPSAIREAIKEILRY